MFGIDWNEALVIGAIALIIIGPKELPNVLRSVGRWVGAARSMAGEFRGHVDDMMRQSEMDDLKKSVTENTVLDLQALDPTKAFKEAVAEGEAEAKKAIADASGDLTAALAAPSGDPSPAPVAVDTGAAPAAAVAEAAIPSLEQAVAAAAPAPPLTEPVLAPPPASAEPSKAAS